MTNQTTFSKTWGQSKSQETSERTLHQGNRSVFRPGIAYPDGFGQFTNEQKDPFGFVADGVCRFDSDTRML